MMTNSYTRSFVLVLVIGARIAFAASAIVFTRVSVIDVRTGDVNPNMSVVIEGAQIRAVGKTANTPAPKDSRIVDAAGKYMIPGLWDMHTHTLRPERLDRWLPLFIANGVTGVRDMSSPLSLEMIRQSDHECQTGQRTGPRIMANGRVFGGGFPENQAPAGSREEAQASVRELNAAGADFIKVLSFLSRDLFLAVATEAQRQGLAVVGHVPESVPIIEAARAGMKSFEHSYGLLQACSTNSDQTAREIQEAIAGKQGTEALGALVRTTDRLYGKQAREKTYSERNCIETAAALVRAGMWQCPTLTVRLAFVRMVDPELQTDARLEYMDEAMRRSWPSLGRVYAGRTPLDASTVADRKIRFEQERRTTALLAARGVPVLAGTDVGNPYVFPGFSLHEEMALLVKAGLSPLAALQAATLNPARFLGREREDDFGAVEEGKVADLVLLSANPLEKIANSERIWAVVANGRYFDRDDIDHILKMAKQTP